MKMRGLGNVVAKIIWTRSLNLQVHWKGDMTSVRNTMRLNCLYVLAGNTRSLNCMFSNVVFGSWIYEWICGDESEVKGFCRASFVLFFLPYGKSPENPMLHGLRYEYRVRMRL